MVYISVLTATIIVALLDPVSANCSKGCTCPTSAAVECNTSNLKPFGMHVFSLKISNPIKPLVLEGQPFNIKGLENVNTISIENATILKIEESALSGISLLSTLNIINCNIESIKDSAVFSKAGGLRKLKISNSTLKTFANVKSEHLEELVLSGNLLKTVSQETFNALPFLTYVDLSNNHISEIDPLSFSKLSFLQEIFLTNNNITSLDSDLFKYNTELVTLDFSNNPLKKFDVNITADLEKLALKSCQLKEINKDIILNLDYLSYLDLSYNSINFTETTFNKMKELDYVDISGNSLTNLHPRTFLKNYKLQKIILDNNNFTVLPKFICTGKVFETYLFSCDHCNIRNLPLETFEQFPALVTLNLANNHITSAGMLAFHYLTSLIELNLSYNAITNLGSDAFVESSALEKLNVAGNPIINIDPTTFENNRVLKTLDFSNCLLRQLWNKPTKKLLSSVTQLNVANNHLSTITLSDLAVINSIEVLDVTNNPLSCDKNLNEMITWLNEHEVSPIIYKTHEEMSTADTILFEGANSHWSWKYIAKTKCSDKYYAENFATKHLQTEIVKKTTKAPEDDDYQYLDFNSDEDSTTSEDSNEIHPFGDDTVGMKISEIISSSKNKNHTRYSFLWPTLVFVFTSLSVLVIAANIMLLMLRTTAIPRNINIPHIKIPQWNSGTKLKKHSGSVYQPLSEEKYDSCISIPARKDVNPTHNGQNI